MAEGIICGGQGPACRTSLSPSLLSLTIPAIPEGVVACSQWAAVGALEISKNFSFFLTQVSLKIEMDGCTEEYGVWVSAPCDFAGAPLRKRSAMGISLEILFLFSRRRAATAMFCPRARTLSPVKKVEKKSRDTEEELRIFV